MRERTREAIECPALEPKWHRAVHMTLRQLVSFMLHVLLCPSADHVTPYQDKSSVKAHEQPGPNSFGLVACEVLPPSEQCEGAGPSPSAELQWGVTGSAPRAAVKEVSPMLGARGGLWRQGRPLAPVAAFGASGCHLDPRTWLKAYADTSVVRGEARSVGRTEGVHGWHLECFRI